MNIASEPAAGNVLELRVTHELKSWPDLFEPLRLGEKAHDLRRATDRTFSVGDVILYREYDPKSATYSGRELHAVVTYITSAQVPCAFFDEAINPAFCILSIDLLK